MKIKLTQDKPKIAYSDCEYVKYAVPYLEPYFKSIIAHRIGIPVNIEKYTAYFYTYRVIKDDARDGLPIIKVPMSPTWRLAAFFDSSGTDVSVGGLITRGFSLDNMYRIFLGDNPCGLFIAKDNVLIASDWTHSSNNIYALEAIIRELAIQNLLVKIPTKTPRKKLSIKLGCDPELEQLATPDGYTVVSPTVNHSTSAEIGVDGSGSQIELRPEPSAMPETIVNRIKELIAQLPPVGILGNRYPLGGHIHIGGVKPDKNTLKLLDDFIGRLSTKTSGSARGSYNYLSAYETKPYGFEYRSPSSTWLHNPEIARITFKLVKNLIVAGYSDDGLEYDMDSTGVPTLASYEKVLTTDEAIEFLAFHKNYKQESKPINYNWGVNPVVPRVSRITFRDDWPSSTVQTYFRRAFTDLSYDYPLYFYGLRADRGRAVANFEAEGFETIYHNPHPDGGGYWFGIPLEIRNASSLTVLNSFLNIATASITKILKGGTYTDIDPNATTSAPDVISEAIMGRQPTLEEYVASYISGTTATPRANLNFLDALANITPEQADCGHCGDSGCAECGDNGIEESELCPESDHCTICDGHRGRAEQEDDDDTMAETA